MTLETLGQLVEVELRERGAVVRGRHLRFRCPAHEDQHPSADYEMERHVWTCRSCGESGGVLDLARRLGVAGVEPVRIRRTWMPIPAPPPGVDRKVWREEWTAIVDRARGKTRKLEPFRELLRLADAIRARHQAVADARRLVNALFLEYGENDGGAWRLLELACKVATEAVALEAAWDEALAALRPAAQVHRAA